MNSSAPFPHRTARSRAFKPRSRSAVALVAALLVLNFTLRLLVIVRPLELVDELSIPDDAYLSLTLARNIAHYGAPLYGAEATNGFQPLYVFIMAPAFWAFPDDPRPPIFIALLLLSICDTLALFFLHRLLTLCFSSRWVVTATLLAWVFSSYVILTTLNGLETSLAFCLTMGALYYFHSRWPGEETGSARIRVGSALALGALVGLCALARIDCLLLVPGIAALFALDFAVGVLPARRHWGEAGLMAAAAAIVYAPWLAYSWIHTGLLFPISGRAVRHIALTNTFFHPTLDSLWVPMIEAGLKSLFDTQRAPMLVLATLVVVYGLGALARVSIPKLARPLVDTAPPDLTSWRLSRPETERRRRARTRVHFTLLAYSGGLFAAYTGYIFGSWYFPRYLFPMTALGLFYLALGLDFTARSFVSGRGRAAYRLLFPVLMVAGLAAAPSFRLLYLSKPSRAFGYMNIGLWARANFKAGTRIGSSQTGALGYFADNLRVFNLDGVVSASCYESLRARRNIEYIRANRIDHVLGFPQNIEFLKLNSANYKDGDLVVKGSIPDFTSWGQRWLICDVTPAAAAAPPDVKSEAGEGSSR